MLFSRFQVPVRGRLPPQLPPQRGGGGGGIPPRGFAPRPPPPGAAAAAGQQRPPPFSFPNAPPGFNPQFPDRVVDSINEVAERPRSDFKTKLDDDSWPKMWFLNRGGAPGMDMNVEDAWAQGYSGRGVSVTILVNYFYFYFFIRPIIKSEAIY